MIRISQVEFHNYRQYKSTRVDFEETQSYDLHILRAKNGTGKTTFLNGILWCLYDNEYYLNDQDKALSVVNNSVVQSSEKGSPIKVSVRITLTSEASVLVFERTQTFFVRVSDATNVKSTHAGESKLKVSVTPLDDASNTTVYEDEVKVQSLVKQYFDKSIYDYYFFDGENLKSYFSKGKSEKIKSSIFNISQVTLLSNAAEHTRTLEQDVARAAKKIKGDNSISLTEEIIKIENRIKELEADNLNNDAELLKWKAQYDEADSLLREYSPIRLNTQKRADLENEIKTLGEKLDILRAQKKEFIVKYLTLLTLYPRVKHTYDLIVDKQEKGTLPPNIDKEQIKKLLTDHATHCPVCNGDLNASAIAHLNKLLTQLDVSSATSNFLMEIKGYLENILDECSQFKTESENIIFEEKSYIDDIKKKEDEAARISAFLSKYADADQKIDVKKAEADRTKASERIGVLDKQKAVNEVYLEQLRGDLEDKKKERDTQDSKVEKKELLTRQMHVLRKLYENLEAVQNSIMLEIKKDIQAQTWKRFESMIWKKNTFGNICIDDNYEIAVYNMTGNEMTGSLSATEYMALAYSFTLAVHDASGKNCPLVVDSPLGRVSDKNRENMAAELLKVSKNKQIIMLFTPDEYSDEVKTIYDSNAASIRDIYLSDNEDQIDRIGG